MSDRRDATTRRPLDPRLLAMLLRRQFEINCVSSVALERPALRPYAKALRDA